MVQKPVSLYHRVENMPTKEAQLAWRDFSESLTEKPFIFVVVVVLLLKEAVL